MWKALTYQAVIALSSSLPRGVQYAIAHRLADLHYLLDARAREAVLENLRVILGRGAPQALVRRQARWVFRSFGMNLCEFFGYRRFGPAYLDGHIVVRGLEHLDRALAAGRGALLVSGHYSNWEIGASMLAHRGYPILIIAQMHADPRVNELFVRQRAAHGVTVAHTRQGALAALRGLRENRPVALLGDRPTGGPVVPVTLCGKTIVFPQGPWRIALATGAALLPTFVHRGFNRCYTLELGAPLEAARAGGRSERAADLARRWAGCLEARLKNDPSQWSAFYKAWDLPPAAARAHAPLEAPIAAAAGAREPGA